MDDDDPRREVLVLVTLRRAFACCLRPCDANVKTYVCVSRSNPCDDRALSSSASAARSVVVGVGGDSP